MGTTIFNQLIVLFEELPLSIDRTDFNGECERAKNNEVNKIKF